MAYKLQRDEPIGQSIGRIAREQLEASLEIIKSERATEVRSIHGVRKRLKKLRALVRLGRTDLGERFGQENVAYRDAARLLSVARDAEVMVQACDLLIREEPERAADARVSEIKRVLEQRRARLVGDAGEMSSRVEAAVTILGHALHRAVDWPESGRGFAAIGDDLRRVYRQGRQGLKAAMAIPTVDHFHQWRKLAKYHWHHMRLLQSVWPVELKARQQELERLSDLLGDDHDLFVLVETVEANADEFSLTGAGAALSGLIGGRRRRLQRRACRLGQCLYAERPGEFQRRLKKYWSVWTRGKPKH